MSSVIIFIILIYSCENDCFPVFVELNYLALMDTGGFRPPPQLVLVSVPTLKTTRDPSFRLVQFVCNHGTMDAILEWVTVVDE